MIQLFVFLTIMTSVYCEKVFNEYISYPFLNHQLAINKVLFEEKTAHHNMMIFQNEVLGRVLVLDGAVQLTEADEANYHEMLAHVPMLAHENPRHILIIGGGDGGTLREVLRHSTVEKVTLVDIDTSVIEQSKTYLPSLSKGAFEDTRLEIIIQDGMDYVTSTDQKFDIIICDTTDAIGASATLYTNKFYGLCKNALNEKGILITQNSCPKLADKELFKEIFSRRAAHFKDTRFYVTVVPTTPGGFVALGWATDCDDYRTLPEKELEKRLTSVSGKMKYYNPTIHKASFALPQHIAVCLPAADVFEEYFCPFWKQRHLAQKTLYNEKTEHHQMMIFQNELLGRVLVLDGIVQLTEVDESTYHEMIVHVPMFSHANPRHVLIIGGGDGGTLREVLRHSTVEKVTLVDIDKQIIEQSKKHLPSLSKGAFEDPRLELIIQDGMDYIEHTDQKFDVIICDSTDAIGAGKTLYTSTFYSHCKDALTHKGILVTQHECPSFALKTNFREVFNRRAAYFSDTSYYVAVIPSTVGGFVAFGWATDCDDYRTLSEKDLEKRLKRVSGKMQYYNPSMHKASFALPQFIQRLTK